MSKFNNLLKEQGKKYLLTEDDLGINQPPIPGSENSAIDAAKTQTPPEENTGAKTLTPEGKRYLIELAVKALGVDSKNLSESDKSIFNDQVTAENAEEMLSRLQQIVEQNS